MDLLARLLRKCWASQKRLGIRQHFAFMPGSCASRHSAVAIGRGGTCNRRAQMKSWVLAVGLLAAAFVPAANGRDRVHVATVEVK